MRPRSSSLDDLCDGVRPAAAGEALAPLVTSSGSTAWVRPVRATDAAELQLSHDRLSTESRYQRFMSGAGRLSDATAAYFTDVDHVNHEALVAFADPQGRQIVGVARFIRVSRDGMDADLALTVADDWQRRGLGTSLLALLAERARVEGVRRFTVEALADNHAIRALVRRAGGVLEDDSSGTVVRGHIPL